MFVPLLILHVILFLSPMASGEAPISKPGCTSSCGNIIIPYPFGIEPGCYADEWFKIFCTDSTVQVPVLNNTNLEVIEISSNGTLKVKNPITFKNCGERKFQEAANLTGSPFVFSQTWNRFTAVSCGVVALMKSADNNHSETIGACMSICDPSSGAATSCNGMNCCQTTIPPNLKLFSTEFDDNRNRGEGCMYAFLVDRDWLDGRLRKFADILRLQMEDVPVVLEWSLYSWPTEEFREVLKTRRNDTRWVNSTSYCEIHNVSSIYNQSRKLRCFCKRGFEGNPYVKNGCQDINECEKYKNICGDFATCRNIPGGVTCYAQEREKPTARKVILGLSTGFGLLLLIIGSWCLQKVLRKRKKVRRKEKFFKRNGGLLLQQQLSSTTVNVEKTKMFNSKELKKATDNFNVDRILGQGGQGTVYKGMLADGRIVAVKKSKQLDESKLEEFINEVVILSQINHRNVVKLLGCCLETEVPLLVYEFIPNGTLSQFIHNHNNEFPFTWKMRLRIATEIAGALSYLHSAASFPIYHRDIKSSNILLDEKYGAKVADFGTSRSVTIDHTHLTTLVHGIFGYLDPEYFQSSQFTEKSDVYSFGVVLVELLTGQKAISMTRSTEGRSLATYFIVSMKESRLFDILHAQVMESPKEEITIVANVAMRCLNLNGKKRPTMKEVTAELEGIQKSEKVSGFPENFEEIEYVRKELIEPWDAAGSTSTGSALDGTGCSSSLQELPLLSFSLQSK
ncbi:hypothetical protein UlMin_020449 [Ulmus minor]